MYTKSNKSGFTLFEVLVVIGISLLLLGGMGLMLKSNGNSLRAEQTAETAASLMKNVQSKARQQEGDARWGVHIDNTTGDPVVYSAFMVDEDLLADPLFTGIPGVVTDTFSFPKQITSTNPALGNSARIIFEKGTGLPTSAVVVVLQIGDDTSSAQTISIDANGRIGE